MQCQLNCPCTSCVQLVERLGNLSDFHISEALPNLPAMSALNMTLWELVSQLPGIGLPRCACVAGGGASCACAYVCAHVFVPDDTTHSHKPQPEVPSNALWCQGLVPG